MKVLVGAFNQEKVLVGAFSMTVQLHRLIDLWHYCRIVFVESVCRVRTLSLTASIAQHVADECLVLWPELAAKHPKTKYIGKFL